ncbi:MAG: hypothetical protein ACLQVF_24925 [Isosphaeraceae bacterium]
MHLKLKNIGQVVDADIRFGDLTVFVGPQATGKTIALEFLNYVPAQRVLTLRNGWPRPLSDFSPGDPFVVSEFSEKLRTLLERDFGRAETLFPQPRGLKAEFRDMLEGNVFRKFAPRSPIRSTSKGEPCPSSTATPAS